jgi:hypothetical protein
MAEYPSTLTALREAQRNGRTMAVEGIPWLIYELPPMSFDRRNSPSLVFESDQVVRRVRDYPANWRSLSDEELFALSWEA